jgi:threonine aldolase
MLVVRDQRLTSILSSVSTLSSAFVKAVVPKNGVYLTLEDIEANVNLGRNVHDCPTRVISLENTLNGIVMPLAEVQRIREFALRHGLLMHCDGARLWDAAASGAGSLTEYCALFDTVTLCFSKGLGAPVGSIVVSDTERIAHIRWIRQFLGGGMRQPGVVTAAARVGVDQVFGDKPDGSAGLLRQGHLLAKEAESLWAAQGGTLVHPADTNMCWLNLQPLGCSDQRLVALGKEVGLRLLGPRLVFHYQAAQNRDEVLKRLEQLFVKVFAEPAEETKKRGPGEGSMYGEAKREKA